jgi:predicted branched-subunit amino acid permease
MTFSRSAFLAGLRDVAPMMLGVAPFGMITGVAAVGIGLTPAQAVGMSVLVFAGASQLAGIALLGNGAAFVVVVATVFVVNLRHTMYSASLAPWLRSLAPVTRLGLSYLMTDHAYAFSILRFRREPTSFPRRDYYLGVGFPLWLVWLGATAVGAGLGARVPEGWHLDFAIPLTFIALLVPAVRDRPSALAAFVAGGLAVLAGGFPYNAGLMVAVIAGLAAGATAESWWPRSAVGEPAVRDDDGAHEDRP